MTKTKHRQSIRIPEYDYSTTGGYFVTICTYNRDWLFGEIVDGEMRLNECGEIVDNIWQKLPNRFPNIELDQFMVMPNHFHGIIKIVSVGAIHELPLHRESQPPRQRRKMLLPKIIGYFKMNTAKQINIIRQNPGTPVWQRNYYEHVIRQGTELDETRTYIQNNPTNWDTDTENTTRRRGNSRITPIRRPQ